MHRCFFVLGIGVLLTASCDDSVGDPCKGIDCGEHGVCTVVQDLAMCDCEPNYRFVGALCVPEGDPTCYDSVQNGDEADVDCGGADCETCPDGARCEDGTDCDSGVCDANSLRCVTLCGNGTLDPGEACDEGAQNSDTMPNRCRESCVLPDCGDGVVDDATPHEELCDDGLGNSDTTPNACRSSCEPARCGDGVVDTGEACDGQNLNMLTCADFGFVNPTGLACTASCDLDVTGCSAQCGNGVVETSETCDGTVPATATCDSYGLPGGGVVSCTGCNLDTSTCCQDGDGDGYGPNCTLGDDCDDSSAGVGITGACQASGCPQGWIHMAATTFEMGCDLGDACWVGNTDESPRHPVTLSAYCIQTTELPVMDYRACVEAGVCTVPSTTDPWCNWTTGPASRELHPVNCVAHSDARAYCQGWVGGDLPTEAQWEFAARGIDQRVYPWGNNPPNDCDECNWRYSPGAGLFGCNLVPTSSGPGTWEVGHQSAGESPHGLLHMAGNVWEWVRDWYDETFYASCGSPCVDPLNTSTGVGTGVARGGAFVSSSNEVRTVERVGNSGSTPGLGFRCVRTP